MLTNKYKMLTNTEGSNETKSYLTAYIIYEIFYR